MTMTSFHQKGFTLIEIIIYLAILGIILASGIGLGYTMIIVSAQRDASAEMYENATLIVNKVQWIVEGATKINSPIINQTATSLSIDTQDTSNNPFVFDASNGSFRISKKNGSFQPITSSQVAVSNVSFTNYAFSSDTGNTIRFKANVASTNPTITASVSIDMLINSR